MILSDRDLKQRLAKGDLKIEPLLDPAVQIQPASVDVRLSEDFIVYKQAQLACLDPRDPTTLETATERVHVPIDEAFILHPGAFALASTMETVSIPHDLVAERIENLSDQLEAVLRSLQRTNEQRAFGVCRTCRFFEKRSARSYRCGLTQEPLSIRDSGLICREYESSALSAPSEQ